MEIIIVINDTMRSFEEYQATGTLNQVQRRSVDIELTEQQLKDLRIKDYESIESISLKIKS